MDTIIIQESGSNITNWISAIASILSFIVAVCTLFLAKKIFKRFEYQAVKPEQIKHMLNFYDFLRNYHFELDLYVINDDDKYNIQTKGYFYYFSNCKALSRGVNQLNEREEIEAEYLTLPILFKDSQFLYSVFYNFIFNYLTPIEIVGILKELSITGAQDIEKEMNQYLYFYDNPNYIMEVKKKTSSVIYTNLSTFSKKVNELMTITEKWFLSEGIDNLNFIFINKNKSNEK